MKLLHLIIHVALWAEEIFEAMSELGQIPYKEYANDPVRKIIIFFLNTLVFVASILAIVILITTRPITMGASFLLPFTFFVAITALFSIVYMDRQTDT